MNRQVTCLDCKADIDESVAQLIAKGKAKANGATTDDVWRCNRCHTVKSRMKRYFKHHEDTKNAYNELAPYEKNEFIASSHELLGAQLAKALELKIIAVQSRTRRK